MWVEYLETSLINPVFQRAVETDKGREPEATLEVEKALANLGVLLCRQSPDGVCPSVAQAINAVTDVWASRLGKMPKGPAHDAVSARLDFLRVTLAMTYIVSHRFENACEVLDRAPNANECRRILAEHSRVCDVAGASAAPGCLHGWLEANKIASLGRTFATDGFDERASRLCADNSIGAQDASGACDEAWIDIASRRTSEDNDQGAAHAIRRFKGLFKENDDRWDNYLRLLASLKDPSVEPVTTVPAFGKWPTSWGQSLVLIADQNFDIWRRLIMNQQQCVDRATAVLQALEHIEAADKARQAFSLLETCLPMLNSWSEPGDLARSAPWPWPGRLMMSAYGNSPATGSRPRTDTTQPSDRSIKPTLITAMTPSGRRPRSTSETRGQGKPCCEGWSACSSTMGIFIVQGRWLR